jgi:peptidyl-Lys metalloendopeptidase
MEVRMNTIKLSKPFYLVLAILWLILLVLAGCGIVDISDPGLMPTEVSAVDADVEGTGALETGTTTVGIEPAPALETLTYTNEIYGFQFDYPETWTLKEEDHGITLRKETNRLGINFGRMDEHAGSYFGRSGVGAGDFIYADKISFMDQVIPAEVLLYEKKSKAVFYGGTSLIEVGDLVFMITLEDLETDYLEVDLAEDVMAEAKSILESFERLDGVEDVDQQPMASEMGLSAYLQLPERLGVGEKTNLKFTLTNESDTPLYILNWYTPLEGIGGEIFRVTREGQAVPYEGILASRTPPTADAYVLLSPGESASAVVDLAEAFDFSKTGEYKIEFISPRISHIAHSVKEMASTMDELGPINIPSNDVYVEMVEAPPSEGLPRLRRPEEAQEMIEAYLRDQGLDLGVEPILPVEELPIKELWDALRAQVFRVNGGKFVKESFLIKGSNVVQLGSAMGGQGLTSLVVTDLDQDGQAELIYAYSSRPDTPESHIGLYAPAYDINKIIEADIGYLGHLRVYSEDGYRVSVQVVEGDQDTKTLRYLDTIGHLAVERQEGDVTLVLQVLPGLPDEVQGRIIPD